MTDLEKKFKEEYKKLNKAQKDAVDSIDGPVMVVAGPGTGKTQILALRIANILEKTQAGANSILCLTFTRSGVSAMRERLRQYIGSASHEVNVLTFHSFGMRVVENFYQMLDLKEPPKMLEDSDLALFVDEILEKNVWEYLRPRGDAARYFHNLRSLISSLKRERITAEEFLKTIEKEISNLRKDEKSISSRGESKGELKKEVIRRIEGLERTKEAVRFFEIYEEKKKRENVFDYDDVLENLVKLAEQEDEVKEFLREEYLYVLIDEHQDSSLMQNEFLKAVWGEVEKPNIFVVGDDRQLIYGFGGASLEYFENFKHAFGKAKLISLTENYRSTQTILDFSHRLLQSKLSEEKLVSHRKETYPIRLVEAPYGRDEIITFALDIKEKAAKGLNINDCALLVPKNKHVRTAIEILRGMGLPVSSFGALNFFHAAEARALLRVLRIINDPYDDVSLGASFFDKFSDIPPLEAHAFLRGKDMKNLSLGDIAAERTLFQKDDKASVWVGKLNSWIDKSRTYDLTALIQLVGDELLLKEARSHDDLVRGVEVVRTLLNLVSVKVEKNPDFLLKDLLDFLDRLESYDENIKIATFGAGEGIKVLTLHGSKGLEFDYVWIAHMDEDSFTSSGKLGFVLPEAISEKLEKEDKNVKRRELYVAITRAKRYAVISYSKYSYSNKEQELAHIVLQLGDEAFIKEGASETEKRIMAHNPKAFIGEREESDGKTPKANLDHLVKLVGREYEDRNISVSLLNNFFECPWKWYFRSLLQLPEVQSESLIFGNKVHKAIDLLLKLPKKPTEADLKKIIGDNKELKKIITAWIKDRLPDIRADRLNEQPVSFSDKNFSHLQIYGRIDLIEKLNDKELRVTDFKTGSPKGKSAIEKHDGEGRLSNLARQLAMYSFLLQNTPKWKGKKVKESCLEFLEAEDLKERMYIHAVGDEELELLRKDIRDYDKSIKEGGWINRKCNYKPYGSNSACEYCKMAEIYTKPA